MHSHYWSAKIPDLISELLKLDSTSLEECLPLAPDAEAELIVQTMGSMKLSDLPQQALLSPAKEQKASSAVSLCNLLLLLIPETYTTYITIVDGSHRLGYLSPNFL